MITTEFEIPFFLKNNRSNLGSYSIRKNRTMVLEVPGFTKSDLMIELEGSVMSIKGKKEILGYSYEIDKKFVLNSDLLSNEPITAKVENGLLFIEFKKAEKIKQTKIEIV